jgi:hypothetical protein
MTDTDIRIVDASPEDPFGFDIDRIHDQLVAGYTEGESNGAEGGEPSISRGEIRRDTVITESGRCRSSTRSCAGRRRRRTGCR